MKHKETEDIIKNENPTQGKSQISKYNEVSSLRYKSKSLIHESPNIGHINIHKWNVTGSRSQLIIQ